MRHRAALVVVLAACGGRVESEPIAAAMPAGVITPLDGGAVPDAAIADARVEIEVALDSANSAGDEETTAKGGSISAAEIAVGATDSCARKTGGTVLCWGWNVGGEVGDGDTESRPSPTPVLVAPGGAPLTNVAEIAVGGAHTCARKTDGTVLCWGFDEAGEVGDGTTTPRPDSFLPSPTPVLVTPGGAPLTAVTEMAVGERHTCARKADGTVLCWGWNPYGQVGDGTTTTPRPSPTPVLVTPGGTPLTGVAEITAGFSHTCARTADGAVLCWGSNDYSQVGDGTWSAPRTSPTPVLVAPGGAPLSDVVEIAAGDWHTCALKADGTVLCWGYGAYGEIGDGTRTLTRPSPTPVLVATSSAPLSGVAEIAAGVFHTCARKTDGTVLCWGDNEYGQVGDGTLAPSGTLAALRPSPTPVLVAPGGAALTGVSQIAAGGFDTCVRKTDGSVLCWGFNGHGEVGDGTTASPRPSPTFVKW